MGASYPGKVHNRARELATAGWKPGRIAVLLASEMGIRVSETTVRRWIDPDYAERQRERSRTGGAETRRWGWKRRLRRILELRAEVDLPTGAIARLASHDFDIDLTTQQVRKILAGEIGQDGVRRLLSGGES